MRMPRFGRILGITALLATVGAAVLALAQPRPPQINVPSPSLQRVRLLEGRDNDDLLATLRTSGRVRQVVEAARFDSVQIEMFNGTNVSLRSVVAELTTEINSFEAAALRSQSAISGQPVVTDAVVETDDAFVVAKSVRVVVTDPTAFARQSEDFRSYLQSRGEAPPPYASLPAEQRNALDEYMRTQLPALDAANPLAQAGARGADALLRAVYDGLGEFEITDTVSFAKQALPVRNGTLMHPAFQNGLFTTATMRTVPNSALDVSGLRVASALEIADVDIPDPPPRAAVRTGGTRNFRTEFLAGFTIGRSWDWERRWNFCVGFFRLSLGASYGVGIRLPMRLSGSASPSTIVSAGDFDRSDHVQTTLRFEPFDADAAFYRGIGLPQSLVFDGKEFVLEANFYYGLKLNAFGVDWVHVPRRDAGFNRSADFRPPFGDRRASFTIEVPPELTGTRFGSRYLGGFAQFGLAAEFEGSASVETRWTGTRASRPFERMRFDNTDPRTLEAETPVLEAAAGHSVTRNYGLQFRNPRYDISASLVPMLRGEAHVDVRFYEHTFSTGWLRLNSFRIPIGSESFSAHAGTPREAYEELGSNTFSREGNGNAAAEIHFEGTYALRVRGGDYVRAGLSDANLLGAASERVGGWERFEIRELPATANLQGILLRSTQNSRFVRAGEGPQFRLTCTSNNATLSEQFSIHPVQGGFVLQARSNGRYVVAERGGSNILAATADTTRDGTVFELVPQR